MRPRIEEFHTKMKQVSGSGGPARSRKFFFGASRVSQDQETSPLRDGNMRGLDLFCCANKTARALESRSAGGSGTHFWGIDAEPKMSEVRLAKGHAACV